MIESSRATGAKRSVLMYLLEKGGPLYGHPCILALRRSAYWQPFISAVESLDRGALYESHCHGEGHIERVIMLGALLSLENSLDMDEARMLLNVCSYHDVGRQDDWIDRSHGARSSLMLERLVSAADGSLRAMRAMMEAHSEPDSMMETIVARHRPPDRLKCLRLARIFKDCDGLDRVRLGDLDSRYLRCPGSKKYASFAAELYEAYRACEYIRE